MTNMKDMAKLAQQSWCQWCHSPAGKGMRRVTEEILGWMCMIAVDVVAAVLVSVPLCLFLRQFL